MKKKLTRLGKFISLILRHKPEMIGIELDRNGWANVDELINGINRSGDVKEGKEERINFEILEEIVRNNSKKRYEFNEDFTKIRACQGHSIDVDLELKAVKPPKILYHGTADRFLEQIKKEKQAICTFVRDGRNGIFCWSTPRKTIYNKGFGGKNV